MARQPVPDTERQAALSRLLPLWPHQIADSSAAGQARLVGTLERALKDERRRGRAGHWSYDLARHAALLRAWRGERALLDAAGNPKQKGAGRRRPAPLR
jgi:hypothetical protein